MPEQKQNGREIHYPINAKKMKEAAGFIAPFCNMWNERFIKLENIVKNYTGR